jgi:nitronate monooxygenase
MPDSAMPALKKRFFVMGTATTVGEAVELERRGVDAVIAQGAEAGGHRGTFAVPFEHGMIGTMALVPQVASSVGVPVVASGGIMDGRGIAAALALGASAVQMGTAFLACHESGIPAAYRDALTSATEARTALTRAFSGRPARGIANRFMEEMGDAGDDVLPFPLQNALTRPLRDAAGRQGRAEFLSLWAGQAVGLARSMRAADLVARLAAETDAVLASLARISMGPGSTDTEYAE